MTASPKKSQRVALIGASDAPEKYSNRAFHELVKNGHEVFPVHPKLEQIEGVKVYRSIEAIPFPLDTVSLYVSKEISSKISGEILKKSPGRIIFNPGAENPELKAAAEKAGIKTLEACTIMMLRSAQF